MDKNENTMYWSWICWGHRWKICLISVRDDSRSKPYWCWPIKWSAVSNTFTASLSYTVTSNPTIFSWESDVIVIRCDRGLFTNAKLSHTCESLSHALSIRSVVRAYKFLEVKLSRVLALNFIVSQDSCRNDSPKIISLRKLRSLMPPCENDPQEISVEFLL